MKRWIDIKANILYEIVKRFFDIILSFTALIALSPILIVVSILVYFNLGSPVFFVQERVGKDNKVFKMIKFRSMKDSKDKNGNYLSDEERKAALCLSKSVKKGMEIIKEGISAKEVLDEMKKVINQEPLAKIDYVSMVDSLTMEDVETVDRDVLVAMAVYIGKTRLIDNFSFEVK